MASTIRARYENGRLTPLEPLDLDEGAEVTVSVADAASERGGPVGVAETPAAYDPTSPASDAGESPLARIIANVKEAHAAMPPDAWDDVPHRPGHEQEALPLRPPEGRGERVSLVFADSGYWIALWNPRDRLHQRATDVGQALPANTLIITTQLVLVETLDSFSRLGEMRRQFAVRSVQDLEVDPRVEIVPQTDAQFRAAVERYAARSDQRWSLTDCSSFLVMEERGIIDALAFDHDFEQAGFAALLRPDPS